MTPIQTLTAKVKALEAIIQEQELTIRQARAAESAATQRARRLAAQLRALRAPSSKRAS